MPEIDWKSFWQSYRRKEVAGTDDLYFEVGKTVNGKPLSEEAFQLSIQLIAAGLELSAEDRLLELCCGNGLVTRCLAPLVAEIRAVDFASHLIENAWKFSAAPNVRYVCGDAVAEVRELAAHHYFAPTKVLLGDCLCYFAPNDLVELLTAARKLAGEREFIFMASGIACEELKWNFYNTPERVRRYEENQRQPHNTNDGIGRWWSQRELAEAGVAVGWTTLIQEQPPELSNFRVDAIFKWSPANPRA
jgi:SAM-dependent methyltransferase